jgi:Ca2+-binding RTX toxin-like protein
MPQHNSDKQRFDESTIHGFDDLNTEYLKSASKLERFNWFKGGNQPDRLVGGQKGDILLGKGGNDLLVGNAGNNRLVGGRGDNVLQGKAGHDLLVGGVGDDQLDGGTGHDRLLGGAGNDILADFEGGDRLNGGRGADLFKIGNANTSNRTIVEDFQVGTDQIRILRPGASFAALQFRQVKDGVVIAD